MTNSVLFQAYGNIAVINECKYALLSLIDVYKYSGDMPHVIIYSDMPEEFLIFQNEMRLTIEPLENKRIKKWRGNIEFVHRVKIEVIKDCLIKYGGKIIYCDTDTCCKTNLNIIFNLISATNVFFHVKEGNLNDPKNPNVKKWKKFLLSDNFPMPDRFSILGVNMWNAGVIALENSHAALLDEVLNFTDALYPFYPKHTVEQFSFCYVFQKQNIHISPAEPFIFHYWNLKELRILLADFFTKHKTVDIKMLVYLSKKIDPEKMLKDKNEFKHAKIISKIIKIVSGKKWSIEKYAV